MKCGHQRLRTATHLTLAVSLALPLAGGDVPASQTSKPAPAQAELNRSAQILEDARAYSAGGERARSSEPGTSDESVVSALDTEYQAAVKRNDATTMARILADDFVLVTGRGTTHTKADLLKEAREGKTQYEHQEDSNQTVRIWGNTAVVTALLWAKGADNGRPFEYRLWFSDTYVRTARGWRYVFGQASLALPKDAQ